MVGSIQHIVVIQSLFDDDVKSGKELYHDVISRLIDYKQSGHQKMTHEFHDVSSVKGLVEILKYVEAKASYIPGGLLLHFEMHGSGNRDGLICTDGSLIRWDELVNLLRAINIKTNNSLYLTMATCYGRFLFEGVNPEEKSPYSGYISASKEVKAEEVIESFAALFECLISCRNLVEAYLQASTDDRSFFYKDSKETFRIHMEEVRTRMFNDPSFKSEIFSGPLFEEALKKGVVDQPFLDKLMYQAFRDIYERHKKAFQFPEV